MKKSYILLLLAFAVVVSYMYREGMCPAPAAETRALNNAACAANNGAWDDVSETCTCPA
jgi:hypothetical protein